ncbi:hypothetical protein AB4156_43325, partial [Cupriavidus sp. 2MCAB6]|uniref:hypothetical protein n=1 Tax=Cupriavidus sp. 2MCAB6 TaxID=3232981 RepID=UPI003F8F2F88
LPIGRVGPVSGSGDIPAQPRKGLIDWREIGRRFPHGQIEFDSMLTLARLSGQGMQIERAQRCVLDEKGCLDGQDMRPIRCQPEPVRLLLDNRPLAPGQKTIIVQSIPH